MAQQPDSGQDLADLDDTKIGARIRRLREARKLTLRGLAAELGMSASALSQIEHGRMRPSVNRLYQIVSLLGASLDEVFTDAVEAAPPATVDGAELPDVAVTRAADQPTIELEQGVRWRRVNPLPVPGTEVLEITYSPGACSSSGGEYLRHPGREIAQVVSGRLTIDVGFESHELTAGDSIMFASTTPHRVTNTGREPSVAFWVTLR